MHRPQPLLVVAAPLVLLFLSAVPGVAPRVHHHHHHNAHNHRSKFALQLDASTPKTDAAERVTVVDTITGISYNPYSKYHPGRHVCSSHKDPSTPAKMRQTFCKPTYKMYTEKCHDNQLCSGIRVVYETAYREIPTAKESKQQQQPSFVCCPGWRQTSNRSYGCNKPICVNGCLNGGTCTKPNSCTCKRGFSGRSCETDVDECKEEKPCDQICINTAGSYRCQCRENYTLQTDGQTCKRDDDEPGYEVKELEVDTLDQRIHTLEVIMEAKKNETENQLTQLSTNLEHLNENLKNLKNKMGDVEVYRTDMSVFKSKLFQLEKKSSVIDELAARYDKMKKCAFYNKICI